MLLSELFFAVVLIYKNFASQTAVICMESIIYDSDYELYINDSLVSFD